MCYQMLNFESYQNFWGNILGLLKMTCAIQSNDHFRIATTCLQRPSFWDPIWKSILLKFPLNNDHLSTTAPILGSHGWYDCTLLFREIFSITFLTDLRTPRNIFWLPNANLITMRVAKFCSTFVKQIFKSGENNLPPASHFWPAMDHF